MPLPACLPALYVGHVYLNQNLCVFVCPQEYTELKSVFEQLKNQRDSKARELKLAERENAPLRQRVEDMRSLKDRLDAEVKQKVRQEHAHCGVSVKSACCCFDSFLWFSCGGSPRAR